MDIWGWKFCLFASILGISIGLFKADWLTLAFASLWWYLALTDFEGQYKEKIDALHTEHTN